MDVSGFQKKLLAWYKKEGRDLPWRRTTDPYAILVSEVMLQQTQVDRVIPYYEKWLREWPSFHALALASKKDVLSAWSGLGYNSRALRLQKLAQVVCAEYGGDLPCDYDSLMDLPGIGPYTAGAVLAFAFNKDVAVVDTNIRRVFIDEFDLDHEISDKELRTFALEICPKGRSRDWYNALMDWGATVRTSRVTGVKAKSRQSKFAGSDRQVRGKIVRILLEKEKIGLDELFSILERENMQEIIEKMERDGVVVVNNGEVRLD